MKQPIQKQISPVHPILLPLNAIIKIELNTTSLPRFSMKITTRSNFARNACTFAVLGSLLLAPQGGATRQAQSAGKANALQSEKRQLTRAWQAFFRALRTLDTQWVVKGEWPGEPDSQFSNSLKFLWGAGGFRSDTYFSAPSQPEFAPFKSTALSFDGQYYRSLRTSMDGRADFSLSDPPARHIVSYDTMPLLLSAFLFVFEEEVDPFTIETLQEDAIWQRFEKSIVSIERGQWQGRQGRWLHLQDPEYAETAKVFVDDTNNFPMFVSGLNQYQLEGKDDTSDEGYDYQVAQTVKWSDGAKTYVYPTRIIRRDWIKETVRGNSRRSSSRIVMQSTAPVKINQPIDAARFKMSIPAKALVIYAPTANSKPSRPYPFAYDPKGGSLWEQEQRERQRRARR
jgi:hypothetical protein